MPVLAFKVESSRFKVKGSGPFNLQLLTFNFQPAAGRTGYILLPSSTSPILEEVEIGTVKIVVTKTPDSTSADQEVLANLEFALCGDRPTTWVVSDASVAIPANDPISVWATYAEANNNMSVFVTHNQAQIFSGMCHWEKVAPYFAFHIKGGDFIELYFQR